MDNIHTAIHNLNRTVSDRSQGRLLPFESFLETLAANPATVIRNVFQVFNDMIRTYVGKGVDEYSGDPESIHYVYYDCSRLFVEGSDHPFFADRLFANRFINHIEALRRGSQQNKIYIFEGPPGCGKSTFLNNLLMRFEEYANTEAGTRYETVWCLDRRALGGMENNEAFPELEHLLPSGRGGQTNHGDLLRIKYPQISTDQCIEVPCPSHDNPILMIPKTHRRAFFDDLFKNDEFKWKLFTEKEYEWVFRDNPCTICSSLYQALLDKLQSPEQVFRMIYARSYHFNRRLGEGISVFNPGDKPMQQSVLTNPMLQARINSLLRDSNQVKYIFSPYAKTNNGIYALMDIKSNNTDRLIELHNIISEGIHKVEEIEENVNSLFFALMNPEDKVNIEGIQSFSDRIEYITIPYILDLNTEVKIYRNIFGKHLDDSFLPRVLHNFARVIISSRLAQKSEGLLEWIGDPDRYTLYCDKNLQLLKMEIYTGYIPTWLTEEDRKNFTAKRRRRIIAESEEEGTEGFSGRDSIKIFNDFYSTYAKPDKLITMANLHHFFTHLRKDLLAGIPEGFLDSLVRLYDYTVLQEIKESLYYYNEAQISRDIQNYLFAINFEPGTVQKSRFTGEKIEITQEFFESIERHLLGPNVTDNQRLNFRRETQKEYTSRTLTQQIMVEGMPITETNLYQDLRTRYLHNLKEKALDPFLENENFRRAIKDFGTEDFKTYDKRIKDDVAFMMENLVHKHHYTPLGAKEVSIYLVDNDLAGKFS